jgi:hypothetical protein
MHDSTESWRMIGDPDLFPISMDLMDCPFGKLQDFCIMAEKLKGLHHTML